MFCRTLAVYVLGVVLQILLKNGWVDGAVTPPSTDITATGSTLDSNPVHCNDLEGWMGNGIARRDCIAAMDDFYSTTVQPHGNREYEFFNREVQPTTHLTSVVTPMKFSHGTCVFIVVEMDYFGRVPLPDGESRVYPKNEIATYVNVLSTATELSSQCSGGSSNLQAGWSVTGQHDSLGVLLVRKGSDLDKVLRSDAPIPTSIGNGTSPVHLIEPSELSNIV